MPETVLVALVSAMGLVLSGVLVELIRARRRQDTVAAATATVVQAVTPNHGSSIADGVRRLEADVRELRDDVQSHGERLAGIEVIVGRSGPRRR